MLPALCRVDAHCTLEVIWQTGQCRAPRCHPGLTYPHQPPYSSETPKGRSPPNCVYPCLLSQSDRTSCSTGMGSWYASWYCCAASRHLFTRMLASAAAAHAC